MDPTNVRKLVNQILDRNNIQKLSDLIHFGNKKAIRYQTDLPKEKGVYAFWLKNSRGIAKDLHRKVVISGPSKKEEEIEWNWNLEADHVLLYVGKSTNLRNRISLHLKLGTKTWNTAANNSLNKITTSCQLRAGIEHLIQKAEYNSFEFLNEYIGISFEKEEDFKDRFFAEDLAIGEGKPWFNIDSER